MNLFPRIKLLVLAAAFCAGCVSVTAQTGASATWRVQRYDLDVALPEAGRVITVKADLSIGNVSTGPAGTLTLRISPSADVSSVKINDAATDFSKSEETINAAASLQRIVMRFPSVPAGGVIKAAVEYKLNIKDNNAVAAFSPVGAQFLPLSYWYPTPNSWYFARGSDAAPFSIHSSQHLPSGLEFVSSGSVALPGQPFFLVAAWEHTDVNGVTVYRPRGAGAEAQKRASEMASLFSDARTYLEGILGKVPDAPLRIVASRRGSGFSGGGTVIVDEAVFRRSKIDSLTAMNIAEAAAKLWLGGSVTVGGDGYGAISEGLSRYLATQFLESKYGKDIADVERLRQRVSYAAVSKRDAPLSTVAPIDDYYFPEVANKGAMVWRILAKRAGQTEFSNALRSAMQDGNLSLAELRAAFPAQKDLLDYLFDKVTDMDLMAGTPVAAGGETKVALRNTGAADVTVDLSATTSTGERLSTSTTIRAASFGEVAFKTPAKIVRVEIDSDKLYPQTDYSDDVAPRETTDSDPLLAAKRLFDKQDLPGAEASANAVLRNMPRFDDLRVLLARALLAENRTVEAEREFHAVLDEKLPTSRSLAWANVGLAEAAAKSNQNDAAVRSAEAAIVADAEYGASLAARNLRSKVASATPVDAGVKAFFADFDRAASANKKADVDAMIVPGEITRFAAAVAGSTQQWQTQVTHVDPIDANTVLVEANMTVKLLNKDAETGMAVYRLVKVGGNWRLAAVEMFEVR
uniref:Uncharacterized protein n=1 Tax=uncultured bacterium 164 TaxID=698382 RepID=E3T6Y6_9BACT|nr:hypothetical protein [uncultured bacterium 164]